MNKYFFIIFISAIVINFEEHGVYVWEVPFKISEIVAYKETRINYQVANNNQTGMYYQIAVQQGHNAPIIIYSLSAAPFMNGDGSVVVGSVVRKLESISDSVFFLNEKETDEILEACRLPPTQNNLFEKSLK